VKLFYDGNPIFKTSLFITFICYMLGFAKSILLKCKRFCTWWKLKLCFKLVNTSLCIRWNLDTNSIIHHLAKPNIICKCYMLGFAMYILLKCKCNLVPYANCHRINYPLLSLMSSSSIINFSFYCFIVSCLFNFIFVLF
jgi:hypothetical protein